MDSGHPRQLGIEALVEVVVVSVFPECTLL